MDSRDYIFGKKTTTITKKQQKVDVSIDKVAHK